MASAKQALRRKSLANMSQRNKRRRVKASPASVSSNHKITATPCNPADVLERQKWNGFCELESEPVSVIANSCYWYARYFDHGPVLILPRLSSM